MSFGLSHGKAMDPALGVVGVGPDELGPLPDDILTNPAGALVDPRSWFPHRADNASRPFEIEIGSGKGTFLVQQAALSPEIDYLGIEWAHEFYLYAADRIRRRREADGALTNVRMLNTDATELLRWRFPPNIARVIHLYFSDPWPKSRHHKKRVIQHRFLLHAWRVLQPGGELRVVTDHDALWAWDEAHFALWTDHQPDQPAPANAPTIPDIPADVATAKTALPDPPFERLPFDRPESAGEGELVGTNFERKFREEGRSFNACVLRKRMDAVS